VTEQLSNPLQTERKIGLLGDVHGDTHHLLTAMRTFRARGVQTVIALGDVGIIWPHENWDSTLNKISRRIAAWNMTLYFVDGNHDWVPKLSEFSMDSDGLRHLRHNIVHLPRGYRTTLLPWDLGWPVYKVRPGKVLSALGGANSIDRAHRTKGEDWWPEESIIEDDLAALGTDHADILIGHDAPLHVPDLDGPLAVESPSWPSSAVEYARQGRRTFHRGFMAVRPDVYVGGHYHRHVDQVVEYGAGASSFRCRVVVLDANGSKTKSLATLDTATLQMEFFDRGDAVVKRLTMRDQGRWAVRMSDAVLALDLDARTVERQPVPEAPRIPAFDRLLPLLNIRMLHVGTIAILTVDPLDPHMPYQDDFSTAVVYNIERVDDEGL
jgi:hypothetical protein